MKIDIENKGAIYRDEDEALVAFTQQPSNTLFAYIGSEQEDYKTLNETFPTDCQIIPLASIEKLLQSPQLESYKSIFMDVDQLSNNKKALFKKIKEKWTDDFPLIGLTTKTVNYAIFAQLSQSFKITHLLKSPLNTSHAEQILQQIFRMVHKDVKAKENSLFNPKAHSVANKLTQLEDLILQAEKDPKKDNFEKLRDAIHNITGSVSPFGPC